MFRVQQQHRVGKRNLALCEDVLVIGPLYAVIDGATDKSGKRYRWQGVEVTAGRFAAECIAHTLRDLPTGILPEEGVARVTEDLNAEILRQYPDIAVSERPSASGIVFDPEARRLWSVGDAHSAWEDSEGRVTRFHPVAAPDLILAPYRALMLAALAANGRPWDGQGQDPGRAAIMPLLQLEGALANTAGPYGFGRLNGMPVPSEHLHIMDLSNAERVVLASDGYPELAPDGALEWEAAEAYLAQALLDDPWCVDALQSTKGLQAQQVSFDDRSWLELIRS